LPNFPLVHFGELEIGGRFHPLAQFGKTKAAVNAPHSCACEGVHTAG